MEQLLNLINEVSSVDEMETVINAIKKKQKEFSKKDLRKRNKERG